MQAAETRSRCRANKIARAGRVPQIGLDRERVAARGLDARHDRFGAGRLA